MRILSALRSQWRAFSSAFCVAYEEARVEARQQAKSPEILLYEQRILDTLERIRQRKADDLGRPPLPHLVTPFEDQVASLVAHYGRPVILVGPTQAIPVPGEHRGSC